MAYKFQTGAAQMDGNLSQEGTLSGSGDLHLATALDINGSQVLSKNTLGSPVLASSLTSVGALGGGSISSGFGAIDNGVSNITTGGKLIIDVNGSALDTAGSLVLGASAQSAIYDDGSGNLVLDGPSLGGINPKVAGTSVGTWDANGIDLVDGDAFYINSAGVLNATTLGGAVVASSLTSVGALGGGSIAAGFGNIDNGTSNITTGGKMVIDVLGTAIDAAGAITLGAAQQGAVYAEATGLRLDAKTGLDVEFCVAGTKVAAIDDEGMDLVSGDEYHIDGSSVLSATTLGSAVVNSSLTSVGNLAGVTSSAGVQFDSTVQLDGVADAALSVSADSLYFLDATNGLMKRDSVADIVGLMAGTVTTTGLEDASGVLNVSIDGLTAATMATGDLLMFDDGAGGTLRKETIDDMFGLGPALCTAAIFSPGNDFVNFLDDGATGECKKDQWSDIATLVAGAGITATDGVFSVTADSSTPNAMSGGTSASPATMDEGLNYGSTAMLGPEQYWTVPASGLALGDVVRVKAPAGVTADNFVRITASVAQNATFDGETKLDLESPYAAVSLFVISADPLIFRII